MTKETALQIIEIDAQIEWLLTFDNKFLAEIEEQKQLKITLYDISSRF